MAATQRLVVAAFAIALVAASCSNFSEVNEASGERGRSTPVPGQAPVRDALFLAEFTDEAGVPVTGANWSLEERAGLAVTEATFLTECMARAGIDYVAPTNGEMALAFGSWEPHPVLGLRRFQAARTLGYHAADIDLSNTPAQQAAAQTRSTGEQAAYDRALTGGDQAPIIEIQAADGSGVTIDRQVGGCQAEAEAALGDYVNRRLALELVLQLDELEAAVVAELAEDPDVMARLASWGECVEFRTGESAATPNDLARKFAFASVQPSARELKVASEDVECQYLTELRFFYRFVHAEVSRVLLGDDARYYDDLGRLRSEVVAIIEDELFDRDMFVPQLD